ncbi:MAG: penicillin acylase family protein [Candidatus Aminicenantes bacterium]|nr:penicillin acylase family protein [Candidatus Aminicenantes bacterium]
MIHINPAEEIKKETLVIKGLSQPVEIIKDQWGISHIYAQNEKDLFFAQGFNVARDRLFQLEVWRRQATGTMAEIQGSKAIKRDIGSRLLKARVDMKTEMNHYHPRGEEIIPSFVRGINAYIDITNNNPGLLPFEFRLLGLKPGHWTPEVVVSRHNGLFRNAGYEISFAKAVNIIGAKKLKSLLNLHPGEPSLKPDEAIDLGIIPDNILELYYASRARVRFEPEDIINSSHKLNQSPSFPLGRPLFLAEKEEKYGFYAYQRQLPPLFVPPSLGTQLNHEMNLGSNNWVVRGKLTSTGHPMMANDPHRSQQIPSLRYWVHLVAPAWNVIGGGEPALPGVSIGHNEYGAWGLTIFPVDQEDLYIYETNSADPNNYRYQGNWEKMKVFREKIQVKGKSPVTVDLKFTRHGPVLYLDKKNNKAYALRAAWLEVGAAPYLASLRMDQARNWEEFRDACSFSRTPSENMVWADIENNIGWQAVGITPLRKNWKGLLPVPGDGRYEWKGYLPIKDLPNVFNPEEGYFATANQDNIPPGYPYDVGFIWTDPYRFSRIQEFLSSDRKLTMKNMMDLQQDVLSIPARTLVPHLRGLRSTDARANKALKMLLSWDYVMDSDSVEAAIYMSWERRLSRNVWGLYIPEKARSVFPRRSLKKMIDFLETPDSHFGPKPSSARDALLIKSLKEGVSDLVKRLGSDMSKWQYGQEKFHHIKIRHMLSDAIKPELRPELDVGPLPRGGNSYTVNNTSSGFNQTSGASFRIIADLENWDNSVGTNSPGQSGDPSSPHYADLFEMWAQGKYFPIFFSRSKIESDAEMITTLKPKL